MRQKSNSTPVTSENLVRNIRSIAELCRREGIAREHVLLLVEGVP